MHCSSPQEPLVTTTTTAKKTLNRNRFYERLLTFKEVDRSRQIGLDIGPHGQNNVQLP